MKMSDPENTTQPLLSPPSQTAINVGASGQSGRPTRAYKVAFITLLACVLIVGQFMIGYFMYRQMNDIKSLEEQNNGLKAEMTKGRSDVMPVRMHMPMSALPELMDDSVDEEASTGAPDKTVPQQATECQLEAAGMKAVQVPGFRPVCDSRGLYRAQQCYGKHCWCVNPVNGQEIPGSMTMGTARCRAASLIGGMSSVLTMPDLDA